MDYLFKHLNTANGLISNQVSSVCQDSKGFIWIGTQTGLQRYDGKRFNTYLADIHATDALQTDWISDIFEDSKKRLWIGTDPGGPYLLDRGTQKFYNFNLHLAGSAKKINGIWQFLEDRQGNIWIAAHDGYYKLNNSTQQFEIENSLLNIGANVFPSGISIDGSGDLWFATTNGIKKLDVKENILYDKNHNPGHLAIFDIKEQTGDLAFDKMNNVWVSTGYDGYIYRYGLADNKLSSYSFNRLSHSPAGLMSQKEYLGRFFISSNGDLFVPLLSRGLAVYDYSADSFSVINAANNVSHGLHMDMNAFGSVELNEDREKNIWITGDKGINIFNLNKPHFITQGLPVSGDASALPASEVSGFLQTADGDVYISYYFTNGGIGRFDSSLNFKQQYLVKNDNAGDAAANQLWNLFQDRDGLIWAPNQAGSILQLNARNGKVTLLKDNLLYGPVNEVLQDADNNIWLAHERKGLVKIEDVTKKITQFTNFYKPDISPRRRVLCLLLDGDKIWAGTVLNGLQLFDKNTGTFTTAYTMNEKDSQSISSNNVIDMLAYNKDTLIIATQGGINIFDKRKKIFTNISSKDGLPNNLVQAVVMDDQRNIWAAFAGGLSKINLHTGRITNYDEGDGIIDNRFNNKFLRLRDGRLLIGASKSFLVFDPSKVVEEKAPPDVTITGFKASGNWIMVDSLVNAPGALSFSYDENSFQVEFASLQYSSSGKIKYFYKLESVDKDWIPADAEQHINYNQLTPGNYVFKVRCSDRDGVFCKNVTTLAIHIIPPFWKRWWFITILSLLIIYGLFIIVKWREKNIKALEADKTKLQQLTAEKYKIQYESEQISSFFFNFLIQ